MPNSTFAITAASDRVSIDEKGNGLAAFTVSNTTPRTFRGRAIVRPKDATQQQWFTIQGESERPFRPEEALQFTVGIQVPQGTPPGAQTFRFDVVNVENVDEDYTLGPTVSFNVPPPVIKDDKRWMWWAAAAAVLIGAVGLYFLLRDTGVPDVAGKTVDEAKQILADAGYNVVADHEIVAVDDVTQRGKVVGTKPAKGETTENEGKDVILEVGGVKIPGDLVGKDQATADKALTELGLKVSRKAQGTVDMGKVQKVLALNPTPSDTPVAVGSTVEVTVGVFRPPFGHVPPFVVTRPDIHNSPAIRVQPVK